jgi:hypothetical protein
MCVVNIAGDGIVCLRLGPPRQLGQQIIENQHRTAWSVLLEACYAATTAPSLSPPAEKSPMATAAVIAKSP